MATVRDIRRSIAMNPSPHFTWQEALRSGVASRTGITNEFASLKHAANFRSLALMVLEPLRSQSGPIDITSGYRSHAVNKIVNGKWRSQHLNGEAADIVFRDHPVFEMFVWLVMDSEIVYDQAIFEESRLKDGSITRWLHVSYRTIAPLFGKTNRMQALVKLADSKKYLPFDIGNHRPSV